MSTRSQRSGGGGLVGAVRTDIQRLHGAWMELVFRRQRGRGHSVMGKWKPETLPQKVGYHTWSALGVIGLLVLYPLTVLGLATRFYAAKLDSTRTRLGIVGVTAVALVGWGTLSVVAYVLNRVPFDAFLAIAAASAVAIVSTTLAAVTSKFGGRALSVLLAYPFAMTALFLPPVVAALVTPSLHPYVLDPSYDFAVWALDNVLVVGGINDYLRSNFSLEGPAYVAMWLGISFPLGWVLGGAVTLANLVRPSEE
ncbi:hypothetical protein BDK88_3313 [Natrinema hispanicum]|uniref:Uncharacterized protein n=1 Tax=Natrinema hispanicum TaxID=392421 RepID=A0A482Y7P1_9EURY|nr:hypothetical protein [Natrinema hispanicum]RZV08341.1 hypothetical protein BDK88_3313 [Natrinema hispanicum]